MFKLYCQRYLLIKIHIGVRHAYLLKYLILSNNRMLYYIVYQVDAVNNWFCDILPFYEAKKMAVRNFIQANSKTKMFVVDK